MITPATSKSLYQADPVPGDAVAPVFIVERWVALWGRLTFQLKDKLFLTRYNTKTITSKYNMPVTWCNWATHSNNPQRLGTIPGLLSTAAIPRTTCNRITPIGSHFVLLNKAEAVENLFAVTDHTMVSNNNPYASKR